MSPELQLFEHKEIFILFLVIISQKQLWNKQLPTRLGNYNKFQFWQKNRLMLSNTNPITQTIEAYIKILMKGAVKKCFTIVFEQYRVKLNI